MPLSYDFLCLALTIAGAIVLVWVCVLFRRHLRQRRAVQQFRGALSILTNTLREGHPFAHAITVLADLGPQPLAAEFRKLKKVLDAGADVSVLSRELQRRLPCFEAEYVVTALVCAADDPRKLSEDVIRLQQLQEKRELARQRIVLACAVSRRWLRAVLLAGPALLVGVALLRPEMFLVFRSQWPYHSAGILLLAGLLVVAGWLVLLLQKQDETEILLD